MLVLPSSLRIFISTEPTDMRRSFDSLAELVRERLGCDPLSGDLYVFFNRRVSSAKLLLWEKSGYWLYYKRLERGKFKFPVQRESCCSVEVRASELSLLLEGIDIDGAKHRATFFREACR